MINITYRTTFTISVKEFEMRYCNKGWVFVTGGVGFVGSRLCKRLLAQGHEVLCVDNFLTVAHLLGHSRVELMRHELSHGAVET